MNQVLEKVASAYTEALLTKLSDPLFWEKPWLNINRTPVNLRGTGYRGANLFFLSLISEIKDWKLPVFLTFHQARKLGVNILRGQKGWPVERYIVWYVNSEGKYISDQEFETLPEEKKDEFQKRVKLSCYIVFNIEQTNLQQVRPVIYRNLKEKYILTVKTMGQENGALDKAIREGCWDCPILEIRSNKAYYNPNENLIVVPLRRQFPKLNDFYTTTLHEMAHSTIHPNSMNRERKAPEGVNAYAHEELIAELSAGLTAVAMGIEKVPSKDNTAYIQSWLQAINKGKYYIFDCLTDAKFVSKYICEHVGIDMKQTVSPELDDVSIPQELSVNGKIRQII